MRALRLEIAKIESEIKVLEAMKAKLPAEVAAPLDAEIAALRNIAARLTALLPPAKEKKPRAAKATDGSKK